MSSNLRAMPNKTTDGAKKRQRWAPSWHAVLEQMGAARVTCNGRAEVWLGSLAGMRELPFSLSLSLFLVFNIFLLIFPF